MYKKILASVTNNLDEEFGRRIQANLIGYTDSISQEALPWAYPLEEHNDIPNIGDKVWIYIEKFQNSEDFDFNYQWYEQFTEETYLETYDMENSETYKIKNDNLIDSGSEVTEPEIVKEVEYPLNRVHKISGITMEFDEGNSRWCLTDSLGNYLHFDETGIIKKSIGDDYTIVAGDKKIFVNGNTIIEDGNGNIIKRDSDGISSEDTNGNTIKLSNSGITLTDKNNNEILLSSSGITAKDSNGNEIEMGIAGITLKTGDASTWKPNILAVDPFSGAPHSTIVKLKGG